MKKVKPKIHMFQAEQWTEDYRPGYIKLAKDLPKDHKFWNYWNKDNIARLDRIGWIPSDGDYGATIQLGQWVLWNDLGDVQMIISDDEYKRNYLPSELINNDVRYIHCDNEGNVSEVDKKTFEIVRSNKLRIKS